MMADFRLSDDEFARSMVAVWLSSVLCGDTEEQAAQKVEAMTEFLDPSRLLARKDAPKTPENNHDTE